MWGVILFGSGPSSIVYLWVRDSHHFSLYRAHTSHTSCCILMKAPYHSLENRQTGRTHFLVSILAPEYNFHTLSSLRTLLDLRNSHPPHPLHLSILSFCFSICI